MHVLIAECVDPPCLRSLPGQRHSGALCSLPNFQPHSSSANKTADLCSVYMNGKVMRHQQLMRTLLSWSISVPSA
jgi:hypothetical protein